MYVSFRLLLSTTRILYVFCQKGRGSGLKEQRWSLSVTERAQFGFIIGFSHSAGYEKGPIKLTSLQNPSMEDTIFLPLPFLPPASMHPTRDK